MGMKVFASSVDIDKEIEIEPQDVIDAIETLELQSKLSLSLPAPGFTEILGFVPQHNKTKYVNDYSNVVKF